MRLGTLLSQKPSKEYVQVEPFLRNKMGRIGQQVTLDVGKVALNYYCQKCGDARSFTSKGNISCIFVNTQVISIDVVLSCDVCGNDIQIWYLVESNDDIRDYAPAVRIIKRSGRLQNALNINALMYGASYSQFLDKAETAYREKLGAGAIVYLRKAFEKITVDTAKLTGITFNAYKNGNPRNFTKLLKRVHEQCKIIPNEFAENGCTLFEELSSIVHGEYDEELALQKFEPLYRLIVGILENVRNREQLREAINALGWEE